MNLSFKAIWVRVLQSFWLIPSALAAASVFAAIGFNVLDHQISLDPEGPWAWFAQTPEGARSILSTIAGSMITVTGVVLSTMIVVLTLASQQYGPRLVKNFIEDRPSQFVIGVFAGCFIYSVITLKNTSSGETLFVPNLSVLFAMLLSLACIGLMIYFVQHVASAIQVQSIMRRVYRDFFEAMHGLFPDDIANKPTEGRSLQDGLSAMESGDAKRLIQINSDHSGYVQCVRDEALIEQATELNLIVEIIAKPGDFVYRDGLLARVRCATELTDEARNDLKLIFVTGTFPTHQQDLTFPIRQMEEIAIRALSPGINDPHTALECVDYLTSAFRQLVKRSWPKPLRYDDSGKLRVIAEPHSFEFLLRQAYQQIFFYGRGDISIVTRIIESLNELAQTCDAQCPHRKTITQLATELADEARKSLSFESHRGRVPAPIK